MVQLAASIVGGYDVAPGQWGFYEAADGRKVNVLRHTEKDDDRRGEHCVRPWKDFWSFDQVAHTTPCLAPRPPRPSCLNGGWGEMLMRDRGHHHQV